MQCLASLQTWRLHWERSSWTAGVAALSACSLGAALSRPLNRHLGWHTLLYGHLDLAASHVRMPDLATRAARQSLTNQTLRLLTYRWYPTAINTADGRLFVISGLDADTNTGCGPACTALQCVQGARQRVQMRKGPPSMALPQPHCQDASFTP